MSGVPRWTDRSDKTWPIEVVPAWAFDKVVSAAREVLKHCDLKPVGETDFERAVIELRRALPQESKP